MVDTLFLRPTGPGGSVSHTTLNTGSSVMGRLMSPNSKTMTALVEVVHFADPWCWWSWGLEPVLRRLKEVYGEQIKVTYRLAGFASSLDEWRKHYDVVEDQALRKWISSSVSMTKMPVDPDYLLKNRIKTTYPAGIAVKAAQLQSEELAEHYLRRMMETIQVEAKNGSQEEVYLPIAREVGLDMSRLQDDIKSGRAEKLFLEDVEAMNVSFLTLVLVNKKTGKEKIVGDVFSAEVYEKAVDELTDGSLMKRTPVDVLEYFERHTHDIIPPREIAEVFGTSLADVEKRLTQLSQSGLVGKKVSGFGGIFWTAGRARPKTLTLDQVKAAHVSPSTKVGSGKEFDDVIGEAVRGLYTEVAVHPQKAYHFPLGREAAVFVGYTKEELGKLPETAVESFAGVGYPHASNAIHPGDSVVDIGSGSGTDVLVAALRTGPGGQVTGLDITDAMIEKARANIAKAKAKNVKVVKAEATDIPLEDASVDVVTSNGVLNLVTDKKKAFKEIYRILKPGGRIQIADIVSKENVQKACGLVPQLWADCIGGAAVEDEYLHLIRDAGFNDVKVIKRLDYFSKSSSENTRRLTKTFGAQSAVVAGTKPAKP